ncbi:unnamed protein product, partial [Pleuronectes platessa]
ETIQDALQMLPDALTEQDFQAAIQVRQEHWELWVLLQNGTTLKVLVAEIGAEQERNPEGIGETRGRRQKAEVISRAETRQAGRQQVISPGKERWKNRQMNTDDPAVGITQSV